MESSKYAAVGRLAFPSLLPRCGWEVGKVQERGDTSRADTQIPFFAFDTDSKRAGGKEEFQFFFFF
jgi:hypothetical protein